MKPVAKRFNKGKLRYELVPADPIANVVKVYTEGAHKYSVYEDEDGNKVLGKDISLGDVVKRGLTMIESGAENWRYGQAWLECMASVERHIAEWKKGQDTDPDLKTKNLANAAWGLLALMEFEKTHPELDNRKHPYLNDKKIGLDIDEVLADFVGSLMERFPNELKQRPVYWNDAVLSECFSKIQNDGFFWLNVKPKVNPLDLPFEPHCYITSRTIPSEITTEWLKINGFPKAKVYTVGHGMSKVEAALDAGIDWFVDDCYKNFVELNKAGICCFLMDATHNQRYDVGYRRLRSLKDLVWN